MVSPLWSLLVESKSGCKTLVLHTDTHGTSSTSREEHPPHKVYFLVKNVRTFASSNQLKLNKRGNDPTLKRVVCVVSYGLHFLNLHKNHKNFSLFWDKA